MRPTYKSINRQIYSYTKGGEYMLDGENYIGEYHFSGNDPYTGPIQTKESKKLKLYTSNKSIIIYDNVKPSLEVIKTYIDPYDSFTSPKKAQYEAGLFVRYFVKRRNTTENFIYELSENVAKLYNSRNGIDPTLYQLVKLPWAISNGSKNLKDIEQRNSKSLFEANKEMPGLEEHITSLHEYSINVI